MPYPLLLFICQTIGAFAPLLSLILIRRMTNDAGLVDRIFGTLRFRGVPVHWFLLSALLPLVIAVATAILHGVLSSTDDVRVFRPEPIGELGWGLVIIIPFSFVMSLVGSPLGEEPGWRGYVFDRFSGVGRGLEGSVLVAIMWWIWHVPLFVVLGVALHRSTFLKMYGHSLLIDSVYIFSGRNLRGAMLYHQGVNTSFMFFASKTQTWFGLIFLLGIAILVRLLAEKNDRKRVGAIPNDGA